LGLGGNGKQYGCGKCTAPSKWRIIKSPDVGGR
jgi:hypothetical protein